VKIYNGTLFGQLPTGFSVNNSPIKTLTVANGDKIFAAITWDRRVLANGDIVSTITSRTIEAAATVPTNAPLTATRYYELATVTLGTGNIPIVAQTRWGPIDDLPGTASNNYLFRYGATGTADTAYYDLLYSSKGHKSDGSDIAPSHDSIQTYESGLCRVYNDSGTQKIFITPITINSVGQITYCGAEYQAWP
jgi:hypothetical protein